MLEACLISYVMELDIILRVFLVLVFCDTESEVYKQLMHSFIAFPFFPQVLDECRIYDQ